MPQDHECYESIRISFGNPNYGIETNIPMTSYSGGQNIRRLSVRSLFTELSDPQKGLMTFDVNDWSSPPTTEVIQRLNNLHRQGLDVVQREDEKDEFYVNFTVTEEDEDFIYAAWRVTDALLTVLGAKNAFNSHPEMISIGRHFFLDGKWRLETDYLLMTHGKNPRFNGTSHDEFSAD